MIKLSDTKERFDVNGDNCKVMSGDNDNTRRMLLSIKHQLENGAEVFQVPQTGNLGVQIKLNGDYVFVPAVKNIFEALAFGNPPKGYRNIVLDFESVDENGVATKMYCVMGCEQV